MATDYLEMTFDSEGTECAASLYRPAGAARSVPCVVMGTGLGGTRNIVLPFYARRFAASGLAALTFDYRRFGGSGGTPRQLMHGAHQQNDYRAAIRFARSLPGIDPRRIALWGAHREPLTGPGRSRRCGFSLGAGTRFQVVDGPSPQVREGVTAG
jgi:dienelactone hydrolase